jgi:hypothetical protein
MLKTIRLTGRRQLPRSAFDFRFSEVNGRPVATLAIANPSALRAFPANSEIRVKLSENKLVQVLAFGTVGRPSTVADIETGVFRAPSCQIRIVNRATNNDGMLLGSTRQWTLSSGGTPDGILLFQPAAIAPRLWSLDIRDQEQPILYIDENIPDASLWARTDPVFAACVLPSVITEVMRAILELDEVPEGGWEADWLNWAATLMQGNAPFKGTWDEQTRWISELVDAFAHRHDLAGRVLSALAPKVEDKA